MTDYREQLRGIRTFPMLVRFLRDELQWPIGSAADDFEDLTFHYTPEELGIDAASAASIEEIKQLRRLSPNQPWGVFFIKFEPKRLPVVALRRILGRLVIKKRASAAGSERPRWSADDLLFISNYGDGRERKISFAHFSQDPKTTNLPTLKVLAWDDLDTPLHLEHAANTLVKKLAWPRSEDESDKTMWRHRWRSAFELEHREVVTTSKALAVRLAALARRIRIRIREVLEIETDHGPMKQFMKAFQDALVHDLDADSFADMYAQTIAYGLLSARIADPKSNTSDDFAAHMRTSPFLKELMETFLTVGGRERAATEGTSIDFDELGVSEIVQLLDAAKMEAVLRDFGNMNPLEDPVIHFYELFLGEYDNEQKVRRGVFFTPRPVVAFIVRQVDQMLKTEFGLDDGLAATTTWREISERQDLTIPKGVDAEQPFVQILDPAVGTATFLVEVIDVVHRTMTEKWQRHGLTESEVRQAWNDYVPTHLLPRLCGFEIMMAPYAIAHLKIGMKLRETGYEFGEGERVHVYLTDSLEPAMNFDDKFSFAIPALAHEAIAVNDVKERQCFTVVVGNPPYLREKERGPGERGQRIGGWIRFGDVARRQPGLFEDFIAPLEETHAGVHAKLAYELSVMFWRLALWLAFERRDTPGIVGFISPRAYLAGPGHAGMRQRMRAQSTEIWITDLGGDNRGARKSENIFDIETGVAIGLCVRAGTTVSPKGSKVVYSDVVGSASEKLARLQLAADGRALVYTPCSQSSTLFMPTATGMWEKWPKLVDIFPWQHSGSQFKRLWPISESRAVLEERWRALVSLPKGDRAPAFIETRDRLVETMPGATNKKYTGIEQLGSNAPTPRILRYAYRTLDRQWCIADERMADFLRPSLVATLSGRQVFGATLMSKELGEGAAVSYSACLPDMDVFCNRGAKDVIPLWRDASATAPNVATGLLPALSSLLSRPVTADDLFSYVAAVLGSPSYSARFRDELKMPGPRIPITKDANLFDLGAMLGARLVWLQTYGERWLGTGPAEQSVPQGTAHVIADIPGDEGHYPQTFRYDSKTCNLTVGEGVIGGVAPDTFGYSVSGFRVVQSWLRYRMKERGGRARRVYTRSVLDAIRPRRWEYTKELLELLWVVEGSVALWPDLESFLGEAVASATILSAELPAPTDGDRHQPESVSATAPLFA